MTDGYVDAGRLEAQVVADLKGFAADLRTKLAAATKGITATVGVKVDTKTLKTQLRALKGEGLTVPVGVDLDTKAVKAQLRALKGEGLTVPVGVDLDAKGLKAQLRALGRAEHLTLPVALNINARGVQAKLRAISAAENLTLPVKLDIDTRGLKAQLAAAARAAGPINVPINPGSAPGPTPGPTPGPGPRNDPTRAVKDYTEAQRDLTRAFQALEKANLAAEGAQRRLSAVQKRYTADSAQVRKAMLVFAQAEDRRTEARKRGAAALEDLKVAARRSVVTVDVGADTARAEEQLAVLSRDRRVNIKADVDKATISNGLRELSGILGKFSAVSTVPLFGGLIVGAVGVVGALGSLSAAIAPVVNNLFLLPAAAGAGAVAIGSLVVGFEGLGGAIKALTAKDLTKWRAALAKLTPAAQDVALAMYQVQPSLTSIRKAVQESLLQGVGGDMRTFARTYLGDRGIIGRALTGSAKSWNAAIRSTFDYLVDTTTTPVVAQGLRQVDVAGQELSRTLRPLANIFVQLFTGGMPFITRMAKGIADMTLRLSDFVQESRQSGAMASFFERGFSTAKQLGRILRDLTIGLGNFFRAGTGEGQGMLDTIEKALARFREFTGSAQGQEKFKQFFRDTRLIMDGVVQTLGVIAKLAGGIGGFFSSWSEDIKRATVPATVLVGALGKIGGGVGKIIGAGVSLTAARTMFTAAALQNTAALNMLRAAGAQAGAAGAGALGGAGTAGRAGVLGRLRGALGIGGRAATGVGGAAVGAEALGSIGTAAAAAAPPLLALAAAGLAIYGFVKLVKAATTDTPRPDKRDDRGFTVRDAKFQQRQIDELERADKRAHPGVSGSLEEEQARHKAWLAQALDIERVAKRSEDLRHQADAYTIGIKQAGQALKTSGLTAPIKAQLKFDIADFTAKAAIVNNKRVKLETEPTVTMLQANVKGATDGIQLIERMLKDPTLTKDRRVKLLADLHELKGVKAEANQLLDIKNKVVKITADKADLDAKIKTTQELLKTPGLLPEVKASLQLQLTQFLAQKDEAAKALAELQTQTVNPNFLKITANISAAETSLADLRGQLATATGPRKVEIQARIDKAEDALGALYAQLAAMPTRFDATGRAAADAMGFALLRALPPAARVAALKAALETVETYNAYVSKFIGARDGATTSANAAEHRATAMQNAKGLASASAIRAELTRAQADARTATRTSGVRTTGPTRGVDGFKDTAADKADKAQDAAAKRAEAARLKREREAAQRAEAVRNAIQAMANRGFVTGLTSTINQIKSAAKQMVGFVKIALGKGALPLTTRINTDTNRLVALAQTRDAVVKRLEDAQTRLKELAQAAAQVRQDIADRVMGTFNLVDGNTATTAGAIIKRLTAAVEGARKFAASLQELRGRGLAGSLLQQLAAAGPAEGQATADALTKATGGELSAINQLYTDMQGSAAVGGKVVADALYGAGIQAATGLVNGLLAQRKTVEASMVTIATALQNAIKIALKIKSPSQVMDALGVFTTAGLGNGLLRPLPGIAASLTGWATSTMNSVRGAFTTGVTGIRAAWNGIVEATKAPVRTVIDVAINKGIIAAYNAVAAQFGIKGATPYTIPKALQAAAPVKLATGGAPGRVRGRGTRTSDSNLALLSRDEHVLAAQEVQGLGGHGAVEALRAAARSGALRGMLPGLAAGGGLTGSGPATFPSMVAWLKKNFPAARASTYQPSFGYHRAPPGGYAADIFTPDVNEAGPVARSVFEGIRNSFKTHIQELIYSHMGGRQVWNGKDYQFTGSVVADHFNHIHWSMLADGFAGGIGAVVAPLREKISAALGGLAARPDLRSPFGAMLAALAGKLGSRVADAGQALLGAGPGLPGDATDVTLPPGVALSGLPGSVTRWAPQVLTVLRQLGQPAANLGAVLRRINFESGGNPNAINLTDVNARAGHPSQGLMQTIPTTFAAHVGPYRGRPITDPLANIYAGLDYAIKRYGSIGAIDPLVRPFGYDNGGWLKPGDTGVNHTRKPEAVFSHGEFDRLVGALEDTANVRRTQVVAGRSAAALGSRPLASLTVPAQRGVNAQADSTGTGNVINVYPRAEHSEREIARGVSRELAWQGRPW